VSAQSALGIGGFVISFTAAGYGVLFALRGVPTLRSGIADLGLASGWSPFSRPLR